MADFNPVYNHILKFEGGYANDPADRGGETWAGIARNANPKWEGWKYVDRVRKSYPAKLSKANLSELNKRLFADSDLMAAHKKYAKKTYWDAIRGDEMQRQKLAEFIMDFYWGSPAKSMQVVKEAVKVVNKKYPSFAGVVDNSTLKALNTLPEKDLFNEIYKWREAFYHKIVEKDPSQKKWLNGWLNRLKAWGGGVIDKGKDLFTSSSQNGAKVIPLLLAGGVLWYISTNKKRA